MAESSTTRTVLPDTVPDGEDGFMNASSGTRSNLASFATRLTTTGGESAKRLSHTASKTQDPLAGFVPLVDPARSG
jgi:hypothetical protein